MTNLGLLLSSLALTWTNPRAAAEFSDWCGDSSTYHVQLGERGIDVRVGDAGRVCDENVPVNLRPVTRFSASGGLTGVTSYYAFFGGRVRLVLRHVKLRCNSRRECQPLRAGERCGVLNAAPNVWPGAEAAFKALPVAPAATPERRLAFDRVAWNALLGVPTAREMIADQNAWAAFGLGPEERASLNADLDYSRRHCDDVEAEPGGGVLTAARVGVLEGERLVPIAEYYDRHWQVSDTAFRSLYKRFDAGAREVWGLRTLDTAPLTERAHVFDGPTTTKPATLDLRLPFLLTQDEVVERRGFFTGVAPAQTPRVISSLDGVADPERWRIEKPSRALLKRAREAFRKDHPRRFECLPRADEGEGEQLKEVAEPFADDELDVYRAFIAKAGDALVGVRVTEPCRQTLISETSLAPVLQRHWYHLPKVGAARLVTKAKEAWLAIDFDRDGSSEWVFSSFGVDERAPYYYALFSRPRGEVVESH